MTKKQPPMGYKRYTFLKNELKKKENELDHKISSLEEVLNEERTKKQRIQDTYERKYGLHKPEVIKEVVMSSQYAFLISTFEQAGYQRTFDTLLSEIIFKKMKETISMDIRTIPAYPDDFPDEKKVKFPEKFPVCTELKFSYDLNTLDENGLPKKDILYQLRLYLPWNMKKGEEGLDKLVFHFLCDKSSKPDATPLKTLKLCDYNEEGLAKLLGYIDCFYNDFLTGKKPVYYYNWSIPGKVAEEKAKRK